MNLTSIALRIRGHVWGPVGSIVFHVLLLASLLAWTRHTPAWRDDGGWIPVSFPQNQSPPVVLEPPLPSPSKLMPPTDTSGEEGDPQASEVCTVLPDGGDDGISETAGDLPALASAVGPLEISWANVDLPGLIGERQKRMGEILGVPSAHSVLPTTGPAYAAESSIRKALAWLKAHQDDDGSWGPDRIAMTGLALLTFLGHNDTTSSGEYGVTVRKAIEFLSSHQQENGLFALSKQMSQPTAYEHAIATYAISEAYGMTRIPELKACMDKAAALIVQGQQPGGLWDYEFKKEARWDTSVSGWQIQALKAALVNKSESPGIADALARAAGGIKSAQADGGRFGYNAAGQGNLGMTGIGALCLQLLGHFKQAPVRAALLVLRDTDCDWAQPLPWPMYTWYYVTQAFYHDQGQQWTAWQKKIIREYVRNQSGDGSWSSPSGSKVQNEETKHGLVYSTTLAALALEAPYRYAPVSQAMREQKQPHNQKRDDDVIVQVI